MTPIDLLWAVPREGGSAGAIFIFQMVLIVAIFYFLLLRPQAKEKQRHAEMLAAVKKGDEIVTNGGIIGKVVHVEEGRLTVRTGDDTRVTVDRSRLGGVLNVKGEVKEE